ncbi:hypothetical protein [Oleisolibacter albus]|uniref:restriction endonuclease subunit S n=1 Tax=Oleisolibacter albus TaxID=2171757 RepID=UPI0012D81F2D|nr:hypothetical protein [Oleisolibacter albus]
MPSGMRKAFAVNFSEIDRWSVSSFAVLDWHWPKQVISPLGKALKRKSIGLDPRQDGNADIKLITIQFTGDIVPREREASALKGNLFRADAGDVVFSKIDVRNGAIGVIPRKLGTVAVTSEFPVYSVDTSVTDPDYIKLLFRTQAFRRKINGMISGASGRKRVQPDDLEHIEVPLPSRDVQRAIVREWQQAQLEAERLRNEAAILERSIEVEFLAALGLTMPGAGRSEKAFALNWSELDARWGVDVNQKGLVRSDISEGKYPVVRLGDTIADLVNGWSPKCLERRAEDDEWGVLRLGAVSFGKFNPLENKALPKTLDPRPNLEIMTGDWLISRANITRLVGASVLVKDTPKRLMLCDKIFRAVWLPDSPIDAEYLDYITKTPFLREQIEANVTGTSPTMKNITKGALLNLRLALPPLNVQQELMNKIRIEQAKVSTITDSAHKISSASIRNVERIIVGQVAVIA